MFRKALTSDTELIAQTYKELLTFEQNNGSASNWQLGVYPTAKVPETKIPMGEMFVLEEGGAVCASMVLNKDQAEEYKGIQWKYPADDDKALVIHTLCIPPSKAGHGYGTQMVAFAKKYAKKSGCTVIRIDTYAHNEPAKKLYGKNGFEIAGYGKILLQGLIDEDQVYMECQV